MNAIDYLLDVSQNVRRLGFKLSSVQVLLAIARGRHRYATILPVTGLHPNSVANILKSLERQDLIIRVGEGKPYVYRFSPAGQETCAELLKKGDLTA